MHKVIHTKTFKSLNSDNKNTVAIEQCELGYFHIAIFNHHNSSIHSIFPVYYTVESALAQYNLIAL